MELRDYLSVIRSRAPLIIATALIVTLTTVVVSFANAPTYLGTAQVLISEENTGSSLGDLLPQLTSQPERFMQTQASVMQLRPLLEKVIAQMRLKTTPEELRERVEVTAVPQTNLITIEVEDGAASRAAAIANAIADAYVEWSRDLKRGSIRTAGDEVERRLAEMQKAIVTLRSKPVAPADEAAHQAEIDAAIARYSALADQLEQLRINEQLWVGSGSVVSRAAVDNEQVAPKPFWNGALALIVGLMLGVGIAFVADYLDNTIKTAEDAERLYEAPVLGQIPLATFRPGEKRQLSVLENPGGRPAEAYRLLRNGLDFVNFERAVKTLLVTSAAPEEGKSTVAANLAAVLSLAGKKTVFIECDFRRPTASEFFDVVDQFGLSDVLTGNMDIGYALQRQTRLENLWVLSSGSMPPNPSELLGSATMQQLIDGLAEWVDWVIVDTPPILAVADTSAAARWADGVLVVVAADSTTREMARRSREILRSVGARLVGIVVRGSKEDPAAHSSYYGYYSPQQAE